MAWQKTRVSTSTRITAPGYTIHCQGHERRDNGDQQRLTDESSQLILLSSPIDMQGARHIKQLLWLYVYSHLLLFLHRQKAKTYSRCKLDQAKTKYSSKWPGVFTVCLTNLVQICLDISLRTWQTMENFIELRLQHWLCLLSFSNCVSRLWKWGNINVITCHVFPIPKVRHEVITPGQAVFSLFFGFW